MGDAVDIVIRFGVFFGAAALAIVFHRRRAARIAFLTVFVTLLCSAGFSGRIHWPFFGWHLYAHAAKHHITFYEVRVADARGRAIRLDARAAPPTMATPLNRIAKRMKDLPGDDGLRIADFLLRKAADYRAEVERRGRVGHPAWKFPAHQMGYRWTADGLADYGPFVELQVVRIDGLFTPDGRGLRDRREQLIVRYQRAVAESGDDRA